MKNMNHNSQATVKKIVASRRGCSPEVITKDAHLKEFSMADLIETIKDDPNYLILKQNIHNTIEKIETNLKSLHTGIDSQDRGLINDTIDHIYKLSERIGANELFRICVKAKLVCFSTTFRELTMIEESMSASVLVLKAELL